ncbi:MAG: alanine--tRNA ligase [Gemmatimonadales bacterium]|nr:alanine--tRNA ligase [Gemmatimonadales bacterium]
MLADTIRRRFLDFFLARDHREVPSSTLAPADDPTLLFTNAGMVQFKRTFLGVEHRDYRRATTAQKCVRAGGKHNDLEQVGHTDRHHTFFEMLGNFSFGDYFKRDAITFAWEFVTGRDWLAIDPSRIRISVHHQDDEARRLWREIAGMADQRIYGLSDQDNFWQMADTGPCGPCSEIYVDLGERGAGSGSSGAPSGDASLEEFVRQSEAGRFLEIWNLVFMQYDRQPGGALVPLPAPSVDTGAGLERIAAVMQGERSNFHTDLFLPLIARAEAVIRQPYDRGEAGAPFRVLADHARAVAFLLADGVYPSNEGRGYVLRRILRRAVRHAYLMGRREPTLVHLVDQVVKTMGGHYPELVKSAKLLAELTSSEEERFLETIEGGLRRMEQLTEVSGEEAFKLYDTYGFPIDLTHIVAAERGITVDVAGFERLLDEQRERSRKARGTGGRGDRGDRGDLGTEAAAVHVSKTGWTRVRPRVRQRWVGYETTRAETDILAFQRTESGVGLVLHQNPFYAESGGQVSDRGKVVGQGWELAVDEVRKIEGRTAVFGAYHGPFEPTPVLAVVDQRMRRDIERNHSATHLLHAALRKVLGTHVGQAGSVVSPERLRFDFTHHHPIPAETLKAIEDEVNEHVWENLEVQTDEMKYADALRLGAMAFFSEKYGDVVRVVTVPEVSRELCGGTHVRTTGQIGLTRLVSESGIGAGVRRIEALTGPGAFAWLDQRQRLLESAAERAGSAPEHLARRVESLVEERRKLEKRVEELIRGGGAPGAASGEPTFERNGISFYVTPTTTDNRNQIALLGDAFRAGKRSGVAFIIATGERPGIHVVVTDDLVKRGLTAPDLVNRIAALSGGKGGGRPHFASSSAGDPTRLGEVERQLPDVALAWTEQGHQSAPAGVKSLPRSA